MIKCCPYLHFLFKIPTAKEKKTNLMYRHTPKNLPSLTNPYRQKQQQQKQKDILSDKKHTHAPHDKHIRAGL